MSDLNDRKSLIDSLQKDDRSTIQNPAPMRGEMLHKDIPRFDGMKLKA
jgi:hypothetical protein